MVDVCRPATLRGFPVSVVDIGDRVRLCHPLLSFEGTPALYVAHRLDWGNDPEALALADPDEASTLGTLLPPKWCRRIASGEGVVAVGTGFVQAVEKAGIVLESEMHFSRVDSLECWVGVATPSLYAALRTRLDEEARSAFDETLGDAALRRRSLSERGNAALFVMRKCNPGPSDNFAIRQLAGALQNRELDLYRRLLIRFAFELDAQERALDERVRRHLAVVADWRLVEDLYRLLPTPPILELGTQSDVLDEKVQRHVLTTAWLPKMYDLAQSGAYAVLCLQSQIRGGSDRFLVANALSTCRSALHRASWPASHNSTRESSYTLTRVPDLFDLNDQCVLVKKWRGRGLESAHLGAMTVAPNRFKNAIKPSGVIG